MGTAAEMMARQRTPQEAARAHREFLEEINQMQTMVARAIAVLPFRTLLHADGSIETEIQHTGASTLLMATLDEFVRAAARRHGFEVPE